MQDVETRGASSVGYGGFAPLGNARLFFADDGVHGFELYRTDGTAAGTQLLKDIFPGSVGSRSNTRMVASADTVYFGATDAEHGEELWRTDGTAAGTALVVDAAPGPARSYPETIAVTPKGLFFEAGERLWLVPPGTPVGTPPTLLAVVNSNCTSTRARLGEGIVYSACNLLAGGTTFERKIWVSDGTAPKVVLDFGVETFAGGDFPRLYSAGTSAFIVRGTKLYKTGGSLATTALVKDFADLGAGYTVGSGAAFPDGRFVITVSGPAGATQAGAWITDGTTAGTARFLDGKFSGADSLNDRVLLVDDSSFTSKVKSIDGTVAGTKELTLALDRAVAREGKWLYTLSGSLNRTDGLVIESLGSYTLPNTVSFSLLGNNKALVTCDPSPDSNVSPGVELCTIDIDAKKLALLTDLNPNTASARIHEVTPTASGVVFIVEREEKAELWSGGTTGAKLLHEFREAGIITLTRPEEESPPLARLGNDVLFPATEKNELGLWATDGSATGTRLITPLTDRSLVSPYSGTPMITSGARAFFVLRGPTSTTELWQTDGTSAQTKLVADSNIVNYFSSGDALVAYGNGVVYRNKDDGFSWFDGTKVTPLTTPAFVGVRDIGANSHHIFLTNKKTLVSSTGTGPATTLVDLGTAGSGFTDALIVGDSRAFLATHETEDKLWVTDGTKAGTTDLGEWYDLPFRSRAWGMDGDTLYFQACKEATVCGLWRSDGTTAGTKLLVPSVADPAPPYSGDENLSGFLRVLGGGKVFFEHADATAGVEPWLWDGTAAHPVTDVAPGARGSFPHPVAISNGATYFLANDAKHGRELWWFVP